MDVMYVMNVMYLMYVCMDGWMDRWMYACICMYVYVCMYE